MKSEDTFDVPETYVNLKIFDSAPDLAKRIFGDTLHLNAVQERFHEFGDSHDTVARAVGMTRTEVSAAYNYAQVTAALKQEGEDASVHAGITSMVANGPLRFLERLVQSSFHRSYADICIQERELLTTEALDKAVFRMYAPESKGLAQKYRNVAGIAIVHKSKQTYHAHLLADKSVTQQVANDRLEVLVAALMGLFEGANITTPPSNKKLMEKIRAFFCKVGVEEYLTITATHQGMLEYMSREYTLHRLGAQLEQSEVLNILLRAATEHVIKPEDSSHWN